MRVHTYTTRICVCVLITIHLNIILKIFFMDVVFRGFIAFSMTGTQQNNFKYSFIVLAIN